MYEPSFRPSITVEASPEDTKVIVLPSILYSFSPISSFSASLRITSSPLIVLLITISSAVKSSAPVIVISAPSTSELLYASCLLIEITGFSGTICLSFTIMWLPSFVMCDLVASSTLSVVVILPSSIVNFHVDSTFSKPPGALVSSKVYVPSGSPLITVASVPDVNVILFPSITNVSFSHSITVESNSPLSSVIWIFAPSISLFVSSAISFLLIENSVF